MTPDAKIVSDSDVSVDDTRQALVEYFVRERQQLAELSSDGTVRPDSVPRGSRSAGKQADFNWASLLTTGATIWWQQHPGRSVLAIAKLVVEESVRRKPLVSLGVAAAVGAALVLVRPWRMASASALALRLVCGTNLKSVAVSLLQPNARSGKKNP